MTTAQLLECGVSRSAMSRWCKRGGLHRIFRGVYALGHPSLMPFARELAAVLACGDGALVSHRSAAELWGMTKPRPGPVDITIARGGPRRQKGIRVHRPKGDVAQATKQGIPTTTPARTLLDYATQATPDHLDRAINEACAQGLTTTQQLLSLSEQSGARPGAARVRAALHAYAGLTRSEAERELVNLVKQAGLPAPQANQLIEGRERDFVWRAERVVLELDAFRTHASPRAFERDHARDAELADWRTERVTARQLISEREKLAARLARALYAP